MASKLIIFLVLGLAVQGTVAAPKPDIGDFFNDIGGFFEGLFDFAKNATAQAQQNAQKVWDAVVEQHNKDVAAITAWVQNAANVTASTWSSVHDKLQDATQKIVSGAHSALVQAGEQAADDASQWVQEAASNLQKAVSAIPTLTHDAFQQAQQFAAQAEAALENFQQASSSNTNQVVQNVANGIQAGISNFKSILESVSSKTASSN